MSNSNYTRRTPEQWQAIINDFSASDLSGAQFCKQKNIQYASFCKWRQRLLNHQDVSAEPAFLDLSSLAGGATDPTWHITLKLGNGVELVLSQI